MARIRSVHPGLLTDEAFMTLTVECPSAIALMLGLWIEADDSGTFEWKPITIKAKCLPALSIDVSELLEALRRVDMIREFELDGKLYGVIRNFVKYQRPKDPRDIHPYSEESRNYAGFTSELERPNPTTGRKSFGTTSEPLRKSFGTTSENSAQRKEEGGRRDDVGGRVEEKEGSRRRAQRSPSASEPKPVEILAEVISPQTAADVVAHRKALRKPLTDRAAREIAKALAATGEAEAAAAHMIQAGWQGFNPEWYANAKARAGPSNQHERASAFRTSKPSANF